MRCTQRPNATPTRQIIFRGIRKSWKKLRSACFVVRSIELFKVEQFIYSIKTSTATRHRVHLHYVRKIKLDYLAINSLSKRIVASCLLNKYIGISVCPHYVYLTSQRLPTDIKILFQLFHHIDRILFKFI